MKKYNDSTLFSWNKKELIEYIHMLEDNYQKELEDIVPLCPPKGVVREFDNKAVVMCYDTFKEYHDIAVKEAIKNNPNIL